MRPLKNRRFISLGVCAVLLAALAAAVGLIARGERVAAGVAPSSSAVVWHMPNSDSLQDGNLTARITTGAATTTLDLGHWQQARAVSCGDGITLTAWSTAQGASVMHLDPGSASLRTVPAGSDVLYSALYDRGTSYYQEAESVVETAAGLSGQLSSTKHPLPALAPDATAGLPPSGYKGPLPGASVGTVEAVVSAGGHPLALTATGQAAGVVDLTDMKASEISGYSGLYGAATGSDGNLYVAAWRCFDPSFTIKVLTIDPSNLQVVAEADTGVTPGTTVNVVVIPWPDGAAVMIAQGDSHNVQQYVWTVDANGLEPASKLPAGIGLYMAPDDNDSVLLFGGPAMNRVSRFNIATGALATDIPELRAPAGSYVIAVQE